MGIVVAGALAYANTFAGLFLFDDRFHINDRLGEGITSWLQCVDGARALVHCTLVADHARDEAGVATIAAWITALPK